MTAPPASDFDAALDAAMTEFRLHPIYRPVLAEACRVFSLNPDPQARPRELLACRGDGLPEAYEPLSVVLVTGGGLKLRWPLDAESEQRLRYQVFHAWRVVPVPRSREQRLEERPLPADLTLPRDPWRTGRPATRAARADQAAWVAAHPPRRPEDPLP